jgi:hypothetical protein
MKKWITCLFAGALISGCSTVPSTPKPHPEKYTFQYIQIEIPEAALQTPDAEKTTAYVFDKALGFNSRISPDAETLIHNPNAQISEYPIVVAGLGESVTNDQTKAVSFPENWEIVDGKAIVKEKLIKLGYSVAVTVDKIENGVISYNLNARYRELTGFNEYPVENGYNIKMPIFKSRGVGSKLTQKPDSWLSLGEVPIQNDNGEKVKEFMYIRVISPDAIK